MYGSCSLNEILSRGTLAPEQTLDGFFAGESVPVNKKLSEIFLQLHISEKSGRGVPKITETYGKDAFEFRKNSIVVTIPFNRLNLDTTTQVTTQVIERVLDDIEIKILEFCTLPKSTREVADFLGFKERKSVSKYLRTLLQEGRIAMTIPNKPNSSKQKYITIR